MKRIRSLAALAVLILAIPAARAEMFILTIYETPASLALRSDSSPKGADYWSSFAAYGDKLKAAGVIRGGGAFKTDDTVRTVQVRTGKLSERAGAYAKSPDLMGGYFLIDVPTLADAVRWASEIPAGLDSAVEVRAFYPVPGMM